jgi:heme exporter protein A
LRIVLGDQVALRGISLSVAYGARVAVIGPNGAGKSTLLRALSGLARLASGEILVHGTSLSADPWLARRAVGVVGHQPMLYPDLTAAENLRFYAQLYSLDRVSERVATGLERVGLLDRAASRVGTLSRGMVQRLSLARALLHEPSILLLDEAESGLDSAATELLLQVLDGEASRRTVLLASHDLAFVQAAASEMVILRHGRVAERLPLDGHSGGWLQDRYAEVLARPISRAVTPAPELAGARRL